ncbi:uracil-DNA glycosylase [Saccharopolyspora rhizosphaerae]|uniref:Type-4 uracil-DNA glycosylase n=1 Tax=Saccharopolyspora rhizosphaerae TaxID=2492662 RepID=A0A426K089_9PSEU|nr:UdgX family uracil-DNA binding protein [Saccharopolyspora rhizosphaerae]RRO18702.1 uracil-DNA glycosylase [Saccharopolyspora rhizosphaerae]
MPQREAGAEEFVPSRGGLPAMEKAVRECRGCDLHENATQAVFGEGAARARVMFVGEQPGDSEDVQGHPFVGPAGRTLDRALQEAGLRRDEVYLTNVVKHFKFEQRERGKRRIHKKPSATEVRACRPWLTAELRLVKPQLVVCLGATAAKALLGSSFRVSEHRGAVLDFPADAGLGESAPDSVVATVHPSSVLRAEDRDAAYRQFRDDLRAAVQVLG